jgi:hypothetical protein
LTCARRRSLSLLRARDEVSRASAALDDIYHRGLACARLGRASEAQALFEQLVNYGEQHRDDVLAIDYFAVSLPDFVLFYENSSRRNRIDCEYMIGLGLLGLGRRTSARVHLARVLALDPAHLGATIYRAGFSTATAASQ